MSTKAYGSITVTDLLDTATYIYYSATGSNTAADWHVTPTVNDKYIGFYSGPPVDGGQPATPANFMSSLVISKYVGEDGISIQSVTNYYLATSASSGVTKSTSGWTTTVQSMDATKQYLWNYEVITGSDNSTLNQTTPVIIGRYGQNGAAGKGITGIVEWYQTSNSNSTAPATPTQAGTGWSSTPVATTTAKPYLWNYEVISYTSGDPTITAARVIGTHGATGGKGDKGDTGASVIEMVSLYYAKADNTPPAAPTTAINETGAVYGNWTRAIPQLSSSYPYMFTCEQIHYNSTSIGTNGYIWTTPVLNKFIQYYHSRVETLQNFKETYSAKIDTIENDYTTSEELNSAISQSASSITSTVSATYSTKTELSNAINNIQIGGRNLAQFTNQNPSYWTLSMQTGGRTFSYETDDTNTICQVITRNDVEKSGWGFLGYSKFNQKLIKTKTTYTISFDILSSVNGTISFYGIAQNNATNNLSKTNIVIKNIIEANTWSHIILQTVTKDSFDDITIGSQYLYMSPSTSLYGTGVILKFKNLKFEEGNKATDWTPAPEDIETRISSAESTIEQMADQIVLKVKSTADGKSTLSAVKLSADGGTGSNLLLTADTVDIAGAAIFSSGRLSESQLNNTYDAKGAASTAQSNAKSYANSGIKTSVTLYYASSSTTAPAKPTAHITTNSASTYSEWNIALPTYSATYPYLYTCTENLTIGGTYTWTAVEQSTYAAAINAIKTTANAAAPKTSAVSEQQRIYYRSKVSTKPSGNALPTTWITNTGNVWNDTATVAAATGWTRKITPIANGTESTATKYLYLWTCIQKKTVSGTITYSDILLDDTTTIIDGGNIITGSVTASQIATNTITADKITTSNLVGTNGWINLANGTFGYGNTTLGDGISWDGTNLIINAESIRTLSSDLDLTVASIGNTNLIPFPYFRYQYSGNPFVSNDITWTLDTNSNTVSASGTASAVSWYCFAANWGGNNYPYNGQFLLPAGTYTLSGWDKNHSSDGYFNVSLYTDLSNTRPNVTPTKHGDAGAVYNNSARDTGDGVTFTIDEDYYVRIECCILSGKTVTDCVCKPMLERGYFNHGYKNPALNARRLISEINMTPEAITINADKINLNGAVSANNYFKINTDGSMETIKGKIGGWNIESTYLYYGTWGSENGLLLCPTGSGSSKDIGGSGSINGWTITSGSTFGVTKSGKLYATAGKIGGFAINPTFLKGGSGSAGTADTIYLIPAGSSSSYSIGGSSSMSGWVITAGEDFGVTKTGAVYASNVHVTGEINATSGTLDNVTATNLTINSGNIDITASTGTNIIKLISSTNANNYSYFNPGTLQIYDTNTHTYINSELIQIVNSTTNKSVWIRPESISLYTNASLTSGITISAPSSVSTSTFLRSDGTWATPTNTTYTGSGLISVSGTTISTTATKNVLSGRDSTSVYWSSTSIASGSWVNRGYFTLAAGWHIITFYVNWAATSAASGAYRSSLATSANTEDPGRGVLFPCTKTATRYVQTCIVHPTTSTTYYFNVYQNSGAAVNCSVYFNYVSIT